MIIKDMGIRLLRTIIIISLKARVRAWEGGGISVHVETSQSENNDCCWWEEQCKVYTGDIAFTVFPARDVMEPCNVHSGP